MTSSQILSTDTSHYSPKPLSSPMTSPVPPRPTNRPMRQLTQTPQFGPALTSSESISRTDSSNSLLGSSSNPVGSPNKIVGSSSNLASMNSPSQESIFSANAESIYSPTGVTNTGSITSPSTEQLISAHAPVTTPPSEPIKTPETNDTVLHPKRQSFSTVDLEDDEMSLR
ncbi:hypothetical protein SARC_09815 [Sphaeroforma arctica JP610]|uniref:Uncharacterized protein n=1 Tax=Sphaeroforma arctica JP610 TaxID=667725 RepID=A0A0L0FMK4_9EUKA|nr:hypothetical protein SARC_09815 [Sphaeroforma arctica JP610]KNC77731.1 hypothetical protein SARC_09815 [Sphaeroforma arctica JP610]|eukprot:XP_014151633.1 hypothetical protein SARC_09815 [Sphaeroforma arctica JP610]